MRNPGAVATRVLAEAGCAGCSCRERRRGSVAPADMAAVRKRRNKDWIVRMGPVQAPRGSLDGPVARRAVVHEVSHVPRGPPPGECLAGRRFSVHFWRISWQLSPAAPRRPLGLLTMNACDNICLVYRQGTLTWCYLIRKGHSVVDGSRSILAHPQFHLVFASIGPLLSLAATIHLLHDPLLALIVSSLLLATLRSLPTYADLVIPVSFVLLAAAQASGRPIGVHPQVDMT